MALDTRLSDAAPRVDRSPEVDALLSDLVRATRPATSRPRRFARFGGVAALGGALAATGAAAAAGVLVYTNATVPDPAPAGSFGYTSTDGTACTISVDFGPRPVSDPHYTPAQESALAAAQAWAADFDLGSLDRDEATETWLRHLTDISPGSPSATELRAHFSAEQLERDALVYATKRSYEQELAERGYDARSLNAGVGAQCGDSDG